MSSLRRNARLQEEIQRTLSEIFEFEGKDPVVRDAFPTVMDVRLSVDARHAKVYVALGQDADPETVLAALKKDRGFYRSLLAERLALRHTPELRFLIDQTVENALRLESMLHDEDEQLDAH